MAFHGVQGRGVLVDLAHHLGDEWRGRRPRHACRRSWPPTAWWSSRATCSSSTPASPPRSSSGTGNPDPRELFTSCAYLDAQDEALLEWIADSQISALVADNYAVEGLLGKDRDPSRHSFLPIHHLCLFKLGVPLGELWYLHELATWLREHERSRFLLTAPPLRLPGIVGSPLTPIATV